MKNKDKKISKKRISKRKQSVEVFSEEDEKSVLETAEELKNTNVLDLTQKDFFEIKGSMGHTTFHTSQSVSAGTYYFEIEIESIDKNVNDLVNIKKLDEFQKKYYENLISNPREYQSTIRVGIINKKSDLRMPLGSDKLSYGYRNSDGAIINDGKYIEGNFSFYKKDVVGILVFLKPPMPSFFKNEIVKEDLDSEGNIRNSESYIKFFINSLPQKNIVLGLWQGEYFPAITLYNFAQVKVNFGRDFKYIHTIENNKSIKSFADI